MALPEPLLAIEAAGNRFALLDAFEELLPADLPALARRVCAAEAGAPPLDGLLVLARAADVGSAGGAALGMIVFNADGGRPEACGNGLRCVARVARERGYVQRDAFVVATDAGPRRVELLRAQGAIAGARAELGVPRVLAAGEPLAVAGEELRATLVDVGNPHCVLLVARAQLDRVRALGPLLERHPRFPAGTNVELGATLPPAGDDATPRAALRVWERGVGETAACGTGAAALVCALAAAGHRGERWRVAAPGGILEVAWRGPGTPIAVGGAVGRPRELCQRPTAPARPIA